ncbi:HK97 family phage prohead protease [Cryobacterium sp. RTC2.1]|uniref:HK97 family phage prohead protease n=1 Tax=Cryobacterium sp. RTC2.1 TaxID=3048634 RepID=UPI002B228386|nr:HK97 family phage prohead protease [Cryobacterium sp. RTC2.1]MEB0001608.1 HK97 family phage prohead protease [Cryobacterium sp. RTC2.1]
MPPNYERRSFERPVELRAASDGTSGPGILKGYGVVFNSPSRDLGGFIEEFDPAAFACVGDGDAQTIDIGMNGRVIARDNHDNNGLLGTTTAGTLRLFVDDIGVRYEIDLPDTSRGRDVAVLAERGDYAFSSFAFRTLPDGDTWRENDAGQLVRVVTGATLIDVAPVADPAYWGSSTELSRSFDLEAVRASLNLADTETAPPRRRAGVSSRAKEMQSTIERSRYDGR